MKLGSWLHGSEPKDWPANSYWAMTQDALWVSNPRNWLLSEADPSFQLDPDFGKGLQSPYAARLKATFETLPTAYWGTLGGAVLHQHFDYLLDRAREHLEVAQRLQDAEAHWLLLNVVGSVGLVTAAFCVPWALRRRRRREAVGQQAIRRKQEKVSDEWTSGRASGLGPQIGISAASGPLNVERRHEQPREMTEPPMRPTAQEANAGRATSAAGKDGDSARQKDAPSAARLMKALAQLVGFSVGFFGAGALLVGFSYSAGLQPRGPGWLFLIVAAGVAGYRMATCLANADNLRWMGGHWWELDRAFRLVLVVGAVWAVTLFLLQDDANLKVVLLPPLALVVLFFAYRFLADTPESPQRPDA